MSNANNPFGFQSLRSQVGAGYTQRNRYTIAAGYATNIFQGDMVKSDGAGGIALAAAGDTILGCFCGIEYTPASNDGSVPFRNFYPASLGVLSGSSIYGWVEDDPFTTWKVQTSATINYANRGALVDLVAGSGNTVTGKSAETVGATGGATFQVLRIRDTEPTLQFSGYTNPAGNINVLAMPSGGQYAVLEVKAIKHYYAGAAAGVTG